MKTADSPNPPLVTVVVPAFNAADFLEATLVSILAQTYREMEIIVVDDGSTDATSELAMQYAARDSRIRLIRQANAGVGAARNAGIAQARGKYIAPVDADDVWRAEKIAAQVAVMEVGGERLGFVYCWSNIINQSGAMTSRRPSCEAEGGVLDRLVFRNFLHNGSVPLFRTSVLKEVGGFMTREDQQGGQGCEDWEMTLRVAERYEVGVVPEYLVDYREIITSMSSVGQGMVRSYEYMISTLCARNPGVSKKALRWSAGYFYLYIARKCHRAGDPASSLRYLRTAIGNDPAVIFAPPFLRVLVGGLWRTFRPVRKGKMRSSLLQSMSQLNGSGVPLHWWLFSKIENLRWSALRQGMRNS